MLEEISCLLANAALIQNLRFNELGESCLQVSFAYRGNRVQQFIGELSSQRCPELGNLSCSR